MLTVEDFSERLFRKMLAVRAPARRFSRKRASPRPLPDLVRSPSQGELALDPEENRAVACSRLTDLLRKASSDASLVKVPLRCLRDAILLNATRAGENAREVEELFTLVDGVVALCHALQSRGAPGPYESVERAVRLRLFLCVAGESWKDHAGLRARAVRKLRAFAVQETQEADHEKEALRTSPAGASGEKKPAPRASAGLSFSSPAATPGRVTTVVAKDAASAPSRLPRTSSTSKTSSKDRSPAAAASFFSRRAPSSVHAAVDVSSWRAVYAELAKVPPSRMMPVVSALLDDLREVESARTNRVGASSFELPAGSTPKTLKTLLGHDLLGPERETSSRTPSRVASLHEPGVPATPAAVPAGWHRFDAPTPGSSGRQSHPQSLKTHVPGSNPERDEFDALMKRFETNA